MNFASIMDSIFQVTQRYFGGATVIWANQSDSKPSLPYVTLKFGDLRRTPLRHSYAVDDGVEDWYECEVALDVNLYTDGNPITVDGQRTGGFANTAVSDMLLYSDYMESQAVTEIAGSQDYVIQLRPPIRDLTELENDRKYRFRAMAQFDISFPQDANGAFGTTNTVNYSGGGIDAASDHAIGYIENVDITLAQVLTTENLDRLNEKDNELVNG